MAHIKCRNNKYPLSEVFRFFIPEDKVQWSEAWADYNPPEYNSVALQNKPWADPGIDCSNFTPKWNELDGKINRKSHTGTYRIHEGCPLNPEGRTGIKGRGLLGRWGPNHAADPIVTRWKRESGQKQIHPDTKLPILQLCIIQRRDSNEWALPGGMIDPGEKVSATLKREFMEEALNSFETKPKLSEVESMLNTFFAAGDEIYKGYVDDPRNTDNAWMETVAVNFHDESGSTVGKLKLEAGDDAKNVQWLDIDCQRTLYANHMLFVKKVVQLRNAHW